MRGDSCSRGHTTGRGDGAALSRYFQVLLRTSPLSHHGLAYVVTYDLTCELICASAYLPTYPYSPNQLIINSSTHPPTHTHAYLPGSFLFLDRFHSSSLRPEETMGDGTHYGGGHANRILDPHIAASRMASPCDGAGAPLRRGPHGRPPKETYTCRRNRTCACSAWGGKDLNNLWKGGVWSFGPMAYERPVVLTHAHMLLGMVLRSRQLLGQRRTQPHIHTPFEIEA